jgi:DNA-binding protein H-NS
LVEIEANLRQSRLARPQEIELAKSYSQLQAQIQKLQAEAEAIKAKELDGVIARIRTAIEHYGITPDQLFGKAKKTKATRAVSKKAPARKSAAKGRPVAIKYRDGENTWTGRGNKPRWLVARLAEGKQLGDFAVG